MMGQQIRLWYVLSEGWCECMEIFKAIVAGILTVVEAIINEIGDDNK